MEHKLHYMPCNADVGDAERERIRQTELYRKGDTVLVWVNEGDLCFVGVNLTPREPELGEMMAALNAYAEATKWATGTEEHRKALQRADRMNPARQRC